VCCRHAQYRTCDNLSLAFHPFYGRYAFITPHPSPQIRGEVPLIIAKTVEADSPRLQMAGHTAHPPTSSFYGVAARFLSSPLTYCRSAIRKPSDETETEIVLKSIYNSPSAMPPQLSFPHRPPLPQKGTGPFLSATARCGIQYPPLLS
jgi:hypothetical protein